MVIHPKIRGFICTTAHPAGCARHVQEQIDYVRNQGAPGKKRRVLVIGASTGYGLASRIAAAFGSKSDTIGVFFERPAADNRTGTAGWYNTAAFDEAAKAEGLLSININGDAFSDDIKEKTIQAIRDSVGQVDLVVYSVAAPRRTHPKTGDTFHSVLKPIGAPFTDKTVDVNTGQVSEVTLQPATEEDIANTVAVMGGEDWSMWIDSLRDAGVLAEGVQTVAFSYIGPKLTFPMYREGTIGMAKNDLERTARVLDDKLSALGGHAFVSVNKGLVTQSSSAIPIVPLYISLLYRVMKDKGLHEDCIAQMYRMFRDFLDADNLPLDAQGRIRLDDLEMRDDVQETVTKLWSNVTSENVREIADLAGYHEDFLHLFGFAFPGVDYDEDISPIVDLTVID